MSCYRGTSGGRAPCEMGLPDFSIPQFQTRPNSHQGTGGQAFIMDVFSQGLGTGDKNEQRSHPKGSWRRFRMLLCLCPALGRKLDHLAEARFTVRG